MLNPTCCIRLATSFNTVQHRPTMLDDVALVWPGLNAKLLRLQSPCFIALVLSHREQISKFMAVNMFSVYSSSFSLYYFWNNLYVCNQIKNDPRSCELVLVRTSHRYREVMSSNPVEVLNFFFRLLFAIA